MKKSSIQSGGFLEDFFEWMGSPEATESMDALDYVFNALDSATVDPVKRRINWRDGKSLSFDQSVDRIGKDSGIDKQSILSHLIGWLQMEYTPKGLDEKQMALFENQIESWLEEYEKDLPPTTDS